jgi:hypothetical protein
VNNSTQLQQAEKNVSFLIDAIASVALHRTSKQLQVTVHKIEEVIPLRRFLILVLSAMDRPSLTVDSATQSTN